MNAHKKPKLHEMDWASFDCMLDQAVVEDAVFEDVTTNALISADWNTRAVFVARQDGVICGLPLLNRTFERFSERVRVVTMISDGTSVKTGSTVAEVAGPARVLLSFERTVLNMLQRLSGVATFTRRFAAAVKGTDVTVMDTRKTTPGWRLLEKYAVRCGGGLNHRTDLRHQVMIKDNHLNLVASRIGLDESDAVVYAIKTVRQAWPSHFIVVEANTTTRLKDALSQQPDVVMLDNMSDSLIRQSLSQVEKACELGKRRPLVEISGGITLENIGLYAIQGVDRISVGALTHSADAMDIAMDIL